MSAYRRAHLRQHLTDGHRAPIITNQRQPDTSHTAKRPARRPGFPKADLSVHAEARRGTPGVAKATGVVDAESSPIALVAWSQTRRMPIPTDGAIPCQASAFPGTYWGQAVNRCLDCLDIMHGQVGRILADHDITSQMPDEVGDFDARRPH